MRCLGGDPGLAVRSRKYQQLRFVLPGHQHGNYLAIEAWDVQVARYLWPPSPQPIQSGWSYLRLDPYRCQPSYFHCPTESLSLALLAAHPPVATWLLRYESGTFAVLVISMIHAILGRKTFPAPEHRLRFTLLATRRRRLSLIGTDLASWAAERFVSRSPWR